MKVERAVERGSGRRALKVIINDRSAVTNKPATYIPSHDGHCEAFHPYSRVTTRQRELENLLQQTADCETCYFKFNPFNCRTCYPTRTLTVQVQARPFSNFVCEKHIVL
ncbi:hypothetical protein J6590_002676 [Homalodisca vitripennis]|nr:hypothetical protein J6590_002676 [Homalodisca vitripennis]